MSASSSPDYIQAKVISHHHVLSEEAFEYFMSPSSVLQVSDVTETSFVVTLFRTDVDKDLNKFYGKAHEVFSYFIISLNVATLGHFTWDFQFISPVPYRFYDSLKNSSHLVFPNHEKYINSEEPLEITKQLVWRTLQLNLALGKEKNDPLKTEYIKGLHNLHSVFFSIKFTNEAFANFYKAFEYFCTNKILGVKRLNKEKKQLRGVLEEFGFAEEILTDFDQIYITRSSKIMHAQRELDSTEMELVIKLKIFLDALMHKHYKPVWEEILSK